MRFQRAILILTALAVAAPMAVRVAAQDAQSKGAALLTEAKKAVGGEDKLQAVKTLQANGSFRRTAGNNTIDGDVEVMIELPDKYRRNESLGFAGGPTVDRTEALNGVDTWDATSGTGAGGGGFGGGGRGGFGGRGGGGFGRRGGFGGGGGARAGQTGDPGTAQTGGGQIDPQRVREAQRRMRQAELSRLMLGWLLYTNASVTWVGTAESPEGNADVLEVKPANGDVTRLFLDVSSHMPLMMTWQGPPVRFAQGRRGRGAGDAARDQGGQSGGDSQAQNPPAATTLAMHFSDYKNVNGIKLPSTITRSVNGQTMEELAIKGYKVNPSFKSDTFTNPKP